MERIASEILEGRARRLYSKSLELQPDAPRTDWSKLTNGEREFWRRRALVSLRSDVTIADEVPA